MAFEFPLSGICLKKLYCSYNPEEHSSKQFEDIAEEELTQTQIHHLVVLERIFLSAKEVEKDESSSGAKDEETSSNSIKNDELQSEITKQKILVAYLKVRLFVRSARGLQGNICKKMK